MATATLEERFRTRISPFLIKYAATLPEKDADALLKQVTPDTQELEHAPGFSDDPLHEEDADIHPFPDIVRKYRSKVLYLTTDECPVYCRYCTRKRKTLLSEGHAASSLEAIAGYLGKNPEINEVIFSGGDPLMLSTSLLGERLRFFAATPTIQYLRLHTRAFTTSPSLLNNKFLEMVKALREDYPNKSLAFVLHVNTAAELSDMAKAKVQAIRELEIPLYAQSVLLRGINDDARALAALCRSLLKAHVQPYYLHQLDRVTGARHFEVDDSEARRIYNELKTLIPPYMVPRFVRDSKQGKFDV